MTSSIIAALALNPDSTQDGALSAYAVRYAEAGNWLLRQVAKAGITDQVRLHRLFYNELRNRFELPSQSAVLCLKDVAKRLARDPNGEAFSPLGPVPYDRHLFNLKAVDRLSLTTLSGRVLVPCALETYSHQPVRVGEASLSFADGAWRFVVRTELSDDSIPILQSREERTMTDKLLTRIARLVAGVTHSAIASAESAAPTAVLEQAIRDIDAGIKDVRAEIGNQEATKYNVGRRLTELREEYAALDDRISVALTEGKDDLAEAGAGRQIDIEKQIGVLTRSIAESDDEIGRLSDSLNALQASRREAEQRLRDLKQSAAATSSNSAGSAPGGRRSDGAAAKAEHLIESAQRLAENLTGVPSSAAGMSSKDLEELAELHRQNAIRERLAQHKARMKSE